MMKAIAIDDEHLPLELIQNYCAKINEIDLVATFSNLEQAKQFLQKHTIDLIILDIQMPTQTGIDFFKSLNNKPFVIFSTAYSQFALEGFQLQAIDYLLKPYTFEVFAKAIQKANTYFLGQKQQNENAIIKVKSDYSTLQINTNEIIFIESFGDFVNIHLQNKKVINIRMTMKAMIDMLSEEKFIRVHRSFIIAIKHVFAVRNKTIFIADRQIPIGGNFEEDFKLKFES